MGEGTTEVKGLDMADEKEQESAGLFLHLIFYQVAVPVAIRDAQGNQQLQMIGPFPDIGSATNACNAKPGSFLLSNIVLYQSPNHFTPLKQ